MSAGKGIAREGAEGPQAIFKNSTTLRCCWQGSGVDCTADYAMLYQMRAGFPVHKSWNKVDQHI